MAWSDQCKIEACNQVKHKTEADGVSPKAAIATLAKESGIPAKTLEHWFYGQADTPETSDDKPGRADAGGPKKRRPETQAEHVAAFTQRLHVALGYANKYIKLPLTCDGLTRGEMFYAVGKINQIADDMKKVTP